MPNWLPDIFAVAAVLLNESDSYRHVLSSLPGSIGVELATAEQRGSRRRFASELEMGALDATCLQPTWTRLLDDWDAALSDADEFSGWVLACIELLVIADEACAGMGFGQASSDDGSIARRADARIDIGNKAGACTLCDEVPTDAAVVLPKARTAQVGCTIRSMSNHLALLPPATVVGSRWNRSSWDGRVEPPGDAFDVCNVLVVPLPYALGARHVQPAARAGGRPVGSGPRYFSIDPAGWVGPLARNQSGKDRLAEFIVELLRRARAEAQQVHALLLPELALDEAEYFRLQEALESREHADVRLFIAGVGGRDSARGPSTNRVWTSVFERVRQDQPARTWPIVQSKHHRWRLDGPQITAYSLGGILDPTRHWWEDIDVESRRVEFFTIGRDSCFATLICEDLARVDPCQSVIRAVGPNLVFALLMDGPQLGARWPGRYAASLADDPGSSVLSVTSLGLLRRSNHTHGHGRQTIGLWRDSLGPARELDLPNDHAALLLNLTSRSTAEYTLDGRGDAHDATVWQLSGCSPIRVEGFADILA